MMYKRNLNAKHYVNYVFLYFSDFVVTFFTRKHFPFILYRLYFPISQMNKNYLYFCHVLLTFYRLWYCNTKIGKISDMAKS